LLSQKKKKKNPDIHVLMSSRKVSFWPNLKENCNVWTNSSKNSK